MRKLAHSPANPMTSRVVQLKHDKMRCPSHALGVRGWRGVLEMLATAVGAQVWSPMHNINTHLNAFKLGVSHAKCRIRWLC